MVECVNKESGSSRVGDQLGTLLAAAYMVTHDKAIEKENTSSWLSKIGFNDILLEREEANDEEDIISEILSSKITVQNEYIKNTVTIGRALIQWFSYKAVPWINKQEVKDIPGLSEDAIKEALEQTGIKPSMHKGEWIAIAQGHPSIRKILEKTAYMHTYYQLLRRSPLTEPAECQGGFAGVQKKYIRMSAQGLLEDVPI